MFLLEHDADRNHIIFTQRLTFRLRYDAEKYDYVNGYDEPYLFTITANNLLTLASCINETTHRRLYWSGLRNASTLFFEAVCIAATLILLQL